MRGVRFEVLGFGRREEKRREEVGVRARERVGKLGNGVGVLWYFRIVQNLDCY